MPVTRHTRRKALVPAVIISLIILFSLVTPGLLPNLRQRNNPLTYALTRNGFVGLPAIILPVQQPTPAGSALTGNTSEIVTTSEQSPPPIPKPVKYPGSPGRILLLPQGTLTPQYLKSLGMKFKYVIVTSSTLLRNVIPLAVIHAAEGMNVLVTTMDWIKAHFPAKKPCDSVRDFARFAHYELGAVYLLLAGDVNVVPTAYWYSEDILLSVGEDAYKATDQYYAFLDGNWDPNGNGKLLETLDTNGDDIPDENLEPLPDSVPDLYVGRLPASSPSQMKALVNNIISYLTNPPPGDWIKRAVLIAAIANFQNESGSNLPKVDLAHVAQYVYELLLPYYYKIIRVYQDVGLDSTAYPHEVSLTHSNVVKLLSEGSGLLFSAAHGIPLAQGMKIWVNDTNGNGIPDKNEIVFRYFLQVWDPVDNHGKRFLAYLESCLTGYYDFNQDSLAEYLLRHSAIAVVASSRVSYYQVPWPGPGGWLDQELAYLFWKELTTKADWKPGPALELSKYEYIKEHGGNASTMKFMSKKDLLDYNLLGDPAITVWVKEPARLNITYGRLKAGTTNKIMVHDTDGKPVARALVAVYSTLTGSLLAYSYTDSSGVARITIPSLQHNTEVYIVARKEGYTYAFRTAYIAYVGAPPVINLISPSNKTIYGAAVPILAHVVDPDGNVTEVNITINGPNLNLIRSYEQHKSEVTVNFTIKANESGTYTIVVSAVDNDGNHVMTKRVFMVDITPPTIIVEGVSNSSATNKAGKLIHIRVNDTSGMKYVDITLDGKVVARRWNLSKSAVFNVTIPSKEGPHALLVVAEDNARNVAHEIILFYVDLTPPTVNVYPAVNNSVINQRIVRNLTITCNDNYRVAYITIYVDGKLSLNVSRYKLKSVDLSKLSDGPHNVTIEAYDSAGNSKHVTLLFYTDSTPPTVKLTGVTTGAYVNKSLLTLQAPLHDNIGLKYVKIILDGETVLKKILTKGNASAYQEALHNVIDVNIKLELRLSNGRHVLKVIVSDLAGNKASRSITFYTDTIPPYVKVLRPRNDSYLNTTDVIIDVNATDNLCLSSIVAYVNDSRVSIVNGIGRFKAPSEGNYILRIIAEDCAGNKAFDKSNFHIDTSPPIITLIKPKANAVIKTPFKLSANIKDNYGVQRIYVSLDGKVIKEFNIAKPLRKYEVNLSITNVPEGSHNVTVMAEDMAGNIGRNTIIITVDNTPPKIYYINRTTSFTAEELKLGFKVNEALTIFKALVDGHPVKVFRVRNNEWLIICRLNPGRHNVTVFARDLAGNIGKLELTITVNRINVFVVGTVFLLIATIVIIAILWWKKKAST